METEAFIIKPYTNQANYMQNMYMQRNKHHIYDKMQSMQKDKYDNEHDGGSKEKD